MTDPIERVASWVIEARRAADPHVLTDAPCRYASGGIVGPRDKIVDACVTRFGGFPRIATERPSIAKSYTLSISLPIGATIAESSVKQFLELHGPALRAALRANRPR